MLEGPSILFLKNKLQRNKGRSLTKVSGTLDLDYSLFENQILIDIETFGQKLIIVFKDFFVTVELDTMTTLLVNKKKKVDSTFSLHFDKSELNFYTKEIKLYQGKVGEHFNFKLDFLKKEFDAEFILNEIVSNYSDQMIGAILLNQNIFPGVGNLIATEILYHAKIHPESIIKAIPEKKMIFLLKLLVDYGEEFLTLLKTDDVKENALIFEKKTCPKDRSVLVVSEIRKEKSKIFICPKCQKLYK